MAAVPDPVAAVRALARELGSRDLRVLFTALQTRPPKVTVTASFDPHAVGVSISARDGWYWWPWAERIAPADDIQKAAALIEASMRG